MQIAAVFLLLHFNLSTEQFLNLQHVKSQKHVLGDVLQLIFRLLDPLGSCIYIDVEALEALALGSDLILDEKSVLLQRHNQFVLFDVDDVDCPLLDDI